MVKDVFKRVLTGTAFLIFTLPIYSQTKKSVTPDKQGNAAGMFTKEEIDRLRAKSDSLFDQGQFNESLACCKEMLKAANALGDDDLKMDAYSTISLIYLFMGKLDDAEKYGRICLERDRGRNDSVSLSTSVNNLAGILTQACKYEEAMTLAKEALQIERDMYARTGNPGKLSVRLGRLSEICAVLGKFDEGYDYAKEAFELDSISGDEAKQAFRKCLMADNMQGMERYDESASLYKECIPVFEKYGVNHSLAVCYYELGRISLHQGNDDESKQYLATAFSKIQDTGDNVLVLKVYSQMVEMVRDKEASVKLHKKLLWGTIAALTVACLLAIALAIVGNKLRKKTKILERQSMMNNRLMSLVSHDMHTGTQSINMAAHMLENQSADEASQDSQEKILLGELVRHSDAQKMLVDNLTQWTKAVGRNIVNKVRFQVNALVKEVVEQMKYETDKKDITIVVDSQDAVFAVSDRNIILTAVRNIMSNAIKFSARGSEVLLQIDTTPDGKVCITIADHGVGMSDDMVRQVKERCISTHTLGTENETGLGLGLSITLELLAMVGVDVDVESSEGTKFVLTI